MQFAKLFMGMSLILAVGASSSSMAAELSSVEQYLTECSLLLAPDQQTRLDATKLNSTVDAMKKELASQIVGQEVAIEAIGDAFELMMSFLYDPEKPMMRLFFVGPTGTGKTEVVRNIVKFFKGNPDVQMIRVDGGTLQFAHEISRLTGTTAGYAGYGDMPMFHPERIHKAKLTLTLADGSTIEFTIVLLDEIEKMHDAAFKLALGLLDNGQVTLGDTSVSNMRKTLVIATSNQGAKDVEQLIEVRKQANKIREDQGQTLSVEEKDLTGRVDPALRKQIFETYMRSIKERFAPEFINRWQKFVQFLHLGTSEFNAIAEILLSKVQKRVFENAKVKFALEISPEAKAWLVSKGTDFRNGARELGNIVELQLTARLGRLITTEEVKEGDVIRVSVEDDALAFRYRARGLNRDQLRLVADKSFPGRGMMKVKFSDVATNELVDKVKVVSGLVYELSQFRKAGQGIWTDAESSVVRVGNVKAADGGESATSYKYISVDDVIVRLSFKGLHAVADVDVEWKVENDGISTSDREAYNHGKNIQKYTVERLQSLLAQVKREPLKRD